MNGMRTAQSLAVALLAFVGLVQFAHADSPSRLDKIKATGTISLGHPTNALPFAYLDNAQHPVGYSVEICQAIVAHLKAALNLPGLKVRYVPVTSATRLPLLANGTIDLECGTTSNTVERQKLVAFTPTTYVAKAVLMARKDSGIDVNDPASFSGKTVAALAGGLDLKIIQEISTRRNLDISVLPVTDQATSFIALKTGRAMGISTDDAIAYASVATADRPADYVIGTKPMKVWANAIVEPRDDPRFKQAVDAAVIDLMRSKKINAIYDRWFNSPLPPTGVNLKYPLSNELERAFEHPTDSADPDAYQ